MRHQGKEEVSGDLYLNLRLIQSVYCGISEFHSSSICISNSDLWFGFLENRKYWASWQYRLFLQIETETVNFRHANCRIEEEEDDSCWRRLPWPAGFRKDTAFRPLLDDFVNFIQSSPQRPLRFLQCFLRSNLNWFYKISRI